MSGSESTPASQNGTSPELSLIEEGSHPGADHTAPTKPFNCVVCKNRKVKCDRQVPCATCTKLNVECQYVEPGPRKKRKASNKQETLVQRLNKYEELLKKVETNIRLLDSPADDTSPGSDKTIINSNPKETQSPERETKRPKLSASHNPCLPNNGELLTATGRSRYYENNLWNSLNSELQELRESILEGSDDDKADDWQVDNYVTVPGEMGTSSFIFGPTDMKVDLKGFHPPAAHSLALWNLFLENILPLCSVVHYPSLGDQLAPYRDRPQDLPRNLEALVFAIYSITILSIDTRQCLFLFQEKKTDLTQKYRYASQQALKNAGLLKTTDLVVLQAFLLFLLELRSHSDYPSLWVITGMAIRIAQRIGVHRDGAKLNLPPFETEMRRRLWREILILDFRTAELSGAGLYSVSTDENAWDSLMPISVNESDIYPGMTEPPKEREGPTENIWCQLRGELGNVFLQKWRKMQRSFQTERDGARPNGGDYYKALDSDEEVSKLADTIETKYLRYCDPVNSLHMFTYIVGRSAIANLRLMTRHPAKRPDGGAGMSQDEKDTLFTASLRIIEYDNLCHSTRSVQKYLWHTKNFFQWHAFIYLLGELRIRPRGPEVDNAWKQIDQTFENHQEWLSKKEHLHDAIRVFALKAWECRENMLRKSEQGFEGVVKPIFVDMFRAMYSAPVHANQNHHHLNSATSPNGTNSRTQTPSSRGKTRMLPPQPTGVSLNVDPKGSPWEVLQELMVTNPGVFNIKPQNANIMAMAPPVGNQPTSGPSSTEMSPINWSEWESLLQDTCLFGFPATESTTGAPNVAYIPSNNTGWN